MSLFKQESLDPLDIDRYLDLDNVGFSPSSSARGKSIQTPEFQTPRPSQAFIAPLSSQKNFSGPSHQYDLHQQQTGLPVGALASSLAATQTANFQLGGFSSNFNYSNLENSEDLFDFNALNSQGQSFGGSTDIDMDFDSPIDGLFPSGSTSDSSFIDPIAIGGRDDAPSPARNEIVRLWPGMHTQQAALAKQQQQQEIQRQQQHKAQQTQGEAAHKRSSSRASGNGTRSADPVVEERISRLLNQMRHSSVGSSNDDATTPQASNSQSQRSKKEDEDMDEDERLLASEEGKKLSSKERRQLRNKVSARAFRSRRKEYIGQLEGEINQKSQENDDLRTENDALKAENTRLTDLSKMLLASPAFSNFLNDLSASGVPTIPESVLPQQPVPVQQPAQQQQSRKDINSQQRQLHSQQNDSNQPSMAVIAESNPDFSAIDANSNWGTGIDFGFNTQVFAVFDVPQGPAVDTFNADVLSGKSSSFAPISNHEAKNEIPVIEFMPQSKDLHTAESYADRNSEDEDDNDSAFSLFADAPSPKPTAVSTKSSIQIFGEIELGKALERIELIIDDYDSSSNSVAGEVDAATLARFEILCSNLDSISARF